IGLEACVVLHADEADVPVEREGDLLMVENLENDDLAAGEAEATKALQEVVRIIEEVADHDHDAARREPAGVVLKAGAEIARAARGEPGEAGAKIVDFAEAVRALEGLAGAVVE